MIQLAEVMRKDFLHFAAVLGVVAIVACLGTGDAKASPFETKTPVKAAQQVAVLGEPVRDGALLASRGTGLDAPSPHSSTPSSGGLAVILWDEPGQGKLGGGRTSVSGNVTVNGTVISK